MPLLSLALLGCGGSGPLGPAEPLSLAEPRLSTRAELEAARARWRALGIANYDVEYRELSAWCCLGRIRVSVRSGTVTVVASDEALGPFTEPSQVLGQGGVDGFFARIEEAFDKGAEIVRTTYDPRLGIPTRVRIDYFVHSADDEIGWAVDEFRRASR